MSQLKRLITQGNKREEVIELLTKQANEVLLILAVLVHRNNNELIITEEEISTIPDLKFDVEQKDGTITLKLVDKEEKPAEA